jgi:CheY-like chemotaxis protein
MRANVEVLVVDDSDNEAALDARLCLRHAAPDVTVLRLTDGEQQCISFALLMASWAVPVGCRKTRVIGLHMPGMDGIEVVQALRARPEMQELSVVLWTSSSKPLSSSGLQAAQMAIASNHRRSTSIAPRSA